MENRYFVKLAFNGANYHGWQIQPNAHTVQELLENVLSTVLGKKIQLTGAGRTDTGVHAREFFAHFDMDEHFSKTSLNNLVYKLNAFLPEDVVIYNIFEVNNDNHARFSAISRTYKYYVKRHKDPFRLGMAWYVYGALNIGLMNKGAEILKEYSDFSSFSKSGTQVKTNNCKITHAQWDEEGHMLVFTITADRFLRNMVRAIVGTLLDLGREKITIEDLRQIIEGKNRSDAGLSVPACGLFLEKIIYPSEAVSNVTFEG